MAAAWSLAPIGLLFALDRGNHTAGTAQLWPWLYATVVAGCVFLLGVARVRHLVAPRWLGFVCALFALRAISYGPASNAGAYLHAVAQAAVYVLLPLIVWNVRGLRFTVLRRAIVVPLVLILAGSLIGIFRHSNPFSYGDVLGSALGHRNVTSIFLAACLPLLLTWRRAPASVLLAASVYVILVNRTRSAWLMLAVYAVGIAIVFAWSRAPLVARVGRRFVLGFVVALACLVLVPTGLRWSTPSPYLKSLTTMASLEESSGRDQIWMVSLSMIRRHPLRGIGGGNYAVHFDEFVVEARADRKVTGTVVGMNDYLQEAAESGVLAGIAMMLVVLGGAVLVLHRAKTKRKWLLAILGLGPLALSADALVDYPLGRVETTILFFVPMALLLRSLRGPRDESVRIPQRLVVASSVAAAALFTFLTSRQALSRYALAEYRATNDFAAYERHYRAWPWRREVEDLFVVRTYLKSGRRDEAAEYARERVRNWPNAPTSRLALALVHQDAGDSEAAARVYRDIFAGTGQCHAEVASAYRGFALAFPERALSPGELPRCLGEAAPASEPHAALPRDVAWKQAQTFLAEWRGEPVFAANWSGRYRPYVWHAGEAIPVLASALASSDIDFFSPTPLSDDELILSGSSNGREDRFDLYLYARGGKLSNLTSSPDANHGHPCVLPSARMISWRERQTQRFAAVTSDGKLETRGSSPKSFDGCEWLDARSLLAFSKSKTGYELSRCKLDGGDVRCEALPALAAVDDVIQLFRAPGDAIGVIARLSGTAFRRAYLVSSTGSELTPFPGVPDVDGDVLGVDGSRARIGLHARYSLGSTVGEGADVVHTFKRIGHEVYAIRSDASAAKYLALETEHGFARIAPKAEPSPTAKPREPLEVWLRTPSGRRIQAFYFGPLDPSRVIVWWHGGPKENVSPRFNPYFDSFEEAGFGVLAVNYPGSTGRGAAFEALFSAPGALLDTADAVLGYLRENGVRTIVSWSVSSGEAFQSLILDARRPVSAIVDEGGGSVRLLRARADAQGVPFFSIHGRFDANFDPSAKSDFVFEGGHALLHLEDFAAMERAVRPFLSSAPALAEGTGTSPVGSASLVLDPGHEGNASDPNEVRGLREASLTFELGHDIMEECALEPAPRLTRTGSATLLSKSDSLGRRASTMRTAETPSVSLHFNASDPGNRSENLASVFLPNPPHAREIETATRLLDGLSAAGLKPKLSYPELSTVTHPVAPGVFVRGGLAVLAGTSNACRFLVEAAYYDDPAEHERLSKRMLSSDGAFERPRVREIAKALCPAMRDLTHCTKASAP